MRRFFSHDDFSDLEAELRDGRPSPAPELLDDLVTRVQPVPAREIASRPRLAFALVFAIVVLVALAAFGGVSYATSSITSAAKSSSHAVSSVVKQGDKKTGSKSESSNNQQGGNKNGKHHEGHGDDDDDPPWSHEYSHYVFVCYPFTVGNPPRTVFRTIVVPRRFIDFFVPPGTRGPCHVGPH